MDGSGDGERLEKEVARQLKSLPRRWGDGEEGLEGKHRSELQHAWLLTLLLHLWLRGLRPGTQSLCAQNKTSFSVLFRNLNEMMYVKHLARYWADTLSPIVLVTSGFFFFLLKSYFYIAVLEVFKMLIFIFYCCTTSKIMFVWRVSMFFLGKRDFLPLDS